MAVIAPPAAPDAAANAAETEASEGTELKCGLDHADAELDLLDPDRYSVEDTVEILGWLTRHERKVLAAKTLAAARLARGNLHLRTGHRSAAESLAAATGDSVGDTKDLIALGEHLAEQPELAASFKEGRLSRRRAALVSRAARVNPLREADLVDSAEKDSDATLKEHCQRAKSEGRSKEDEARHFTRIHESRRCRTWTDDDGALCLHAVLSPQVGAGVLAALDAQGDRQFRRARDEGRFENHDAYRADALVALVTGNGLLGPKGRTPTSTTGAQVTTHVPATPDTPGTAGASDAPAVGAADPKASLLVVTDLETLRNGKVGPGGRCEIPGVGPIPVEHAHRLLGEALVELIIAHGTDVTTVYSAGRHIPRRVRSALLLRDPRCVVPGCDARLGLENDHWVTDFAKGGLTSLDNLVRICKRHHRDRTHRGFTLDKVGDNWIWTAPAEVADSTPKRRAKRRPAGSPGRAGPTRLDPVSLPLQE
jgi:5-methylcytosine-specific restriction endonuclease McrA